MFNHYLLLLFMGVSVTLPLISGKAVDVLSARVSRIFNGNYDTENQYRYHVAILRILPNDTSEHVCGGAIIDSRYVLTAAHCVFNEKKENLVIRSGWDKSPAHDYLEKRSYHEVARIMYPKEYHYSSCRHHEQDIAILKVRRSFDLVDEQNYKKVFLPEYDNDYEDYTVTFTGYGVDSISLILNESNNGTGAEFEYPEELKFLQAKVMPLEECKRNASVILTSGNICTEPQSATGFSCIGDSGGPLVHDGVIIGIRNSHNKECIQGTPELFTRVSSYLNFIQKVLNHESSYNIVYV